MDQDQQRKAHTYRLIKLGGLIHKAGIGDFPPNVILGMAMDAAERCKDPNEIVRLSILGDKGFDRGRPE
jgi:hypothetical protein